MGRQIEGLNALRTVAEAFWYEAFGVFFREGCYHDAIALTTSMLGICEIGECSHYIKALHEIVPLINSKRLRQAYNNFIKDIEGKITTDGRLSSHDLIDLK